MATATKERTVNTARTYVEESKLNTLLHLLDRAEDYANQVLENYEATFPGEKLSLQQFEKVLLTYNRTDIDNFFMQRLAKIMSPNAKTQADLDSIARNLTYDHSWDRITAPLSSLTHNQWYDALEELNFTKGRFVLSKAKREEIEKRFTHEIPEKALKIISHIEQLWEIKQSFEEMGLPNPFAQYYFRYTLGMFTVNPSLGKNSAMYRELKEEETLYDLQAIFQYIDAIEKKKIR